MIRTVSVIRLVEPELFLDEMPAQTTRILLLVATALGVMTPSPPGHASPNEVFASGSTLAVILAPAQSSSQTLDFMKAANRRYMVCPEPDWDHAVSAGVDETVRYELFGAVALSNEIRCRGVQRSRVPLCHPRNLRGDWLFSDATKACCRGSGGNRTCSEANIYCSSASSFTYNPSTGRCDDDEPQWRPAWAGESQTDYHTATWDTSFADVGQTVTCPSGYTLSGGSPTDRRYVCEKPTSGGYVDFAPTCQGAGFNFAPNLKQCCGRQTLSSPLTCSTNGITCPSDATYLSFKGKCRISTDVIYAAPVLVLD
jgi:hypothetical protein